MKKILVLVALATLVASSAFAATVVGSKHDMTSTSAGFPTAATGTTEVCIFCHTPHGGASEVPLWNRNDHSGSTTPYNSSTFDSTAGTTDALRCLSCHDGAFISSSTVINDVNTATTINMAGTTVTGMANIGTDLTNDHPVGIDYTTSGGGMKTAAEVRATNALLLQDGDNVWCSSCHNVHDFTNTPFLRISNANSDLCLACHNK